LRPARGVPRPAGHVPADHQSPYRNHNWDNALWKLGCGCNSRRPTTMRTIPQTDRYLCDRVLTGSAIAAVRCADCAKSPCPRATGSEAELGTKWEQDWQYQPNAATIYVRWGNIITASQSKPLSITATCFQYHKYGRRTGLKIQRVCHAHLPATRPRDTVCKTVWSLTPDGKRCGPSSWQISRGRDSGSDNWQTHRTCYGVGQPLVSPPIWQTPRA
jgi:hypothetical protein